MKNLTEYSRQKRSPLFDVGEKAVLICHWHYRNSAAFEVDDEKTKALPQGFKEPCEFCKRTGNSYPNAACWVVNVTKVEEGIAS